jgi:hypothetical protein
MKIHNPSALPALVEALEKEKNREEGDMSCYREVMLAITIIGGEKVADILLSLAEERVQLFLDAPEGGGEIPWNQDVLPPADKIIEALGVSEDIRASRLLVKLLNKPLHFYLLVSTGEALEFLTNHYFGFDASKNNRWWSQSGYPGPDPMPGFRAWWKENEGKSHEDWVVSGFEKAGYTLLPPSDPKGLEILVKALTDKLGCIRFNAYMRLSRRTGVDFDRRRVRAFSPSRLQFRRGIAPRYRAWLAKHRDRLVWNAERGRFDVKD